MGKDDEREAVRPRQRQISQEIKDASLPTMKKKINKFIYWTPRILSIIFILFLAMFSLDIFEGNYGFWGTVVGLFMHNIPSLILLIILLVSWKHEIVGGIAFIMAGLFYCAA